MRPTVFLIDADPAMAELLGEWLDAEGIEVIDDRVAASASAQGYDLAIVDLPFPRQGGAKRIADLVHEHPSMPIIAVSAAFFPCVLCCGGVARELGVAFVLPKPLARDTLLAAVHQLLDEDRPQVSLG